MIFAELRPTFEFMAQSEVHGAPGVVMIDSGQPGPTVGISAMTHGDEPAGLALFRFLLEENWLERHLQRGRVFLAVNNLEGAKRFFCAENYEDRHQARFLDLNFNRMPEDTLDLKGDLRYEVQRTHELYPVFEQFEYGLDIHSTTLETDPMLICGRHVEPELIRNFPVEIVLTDIVTHQLNIPVTDFYGGIEKQIPIYAIECGSHENPDSFERAIGCGLSLLANLGMIEREADPEPVSQRVYQIVGTVLFPDHSYELTQVYEMFAEAKAGEVLAKGDGPSIVMPCDGHLLMGPKTLKPRNISEEVFFISRPVETELV